MILLIKGSVVHYPLNSGIDGPTIDTQDDQGWVLTSTLESERIGTHTKWGVIDLHDPDRSVLREFGVASVIVVPIPHGARVTVFLDRTAGGPSELVHAIKMMERSMDNILSLAGFTPNAATCAPLEAIWCDNRADLRQETGSGASSDSILPARVNGSTPEHS